MEIGEREELIAMYESGYDVVKEALDGITQAELDSPEAPGEWTPRQVAHHLGDSEMTAAVRLRRLIAEDRPLIVAYDQDEFARTLFYDRPIEASLAAFKAARESTVPILRSLTEGQWNRSGVHSEAGEFGIMKWLELAAVHARDHAAQIKRGRAAAAR